MFTGDLADGSPRTLPMIPPPLMDLSAPFGKYFVTGNHEYYSGAKRWLLEVRRLGFEPLINSHRILEYNRALLTLCRCDGYPGRRFFQRSIAQIPKRLFKGVLTTVSSCCVPISRSASFLQQHKVLICNCPVTPTAASFSRSVI